MNFYEQWNEHDYNPFILFDKNGKVTNVNNEAQYLLGEVSKQEIFELCQTYANITYGFKTTVIDLKYGNYSFYAITIGYENEEEIGVKLYKKPKENFNLLPETGSKENIYTILDLCISSISTAKDIHFIKEFDPTFPEIKLQTDKFIQILNKIYHSFIKSKTIITSLSLQTGEYIKFHDKKFKIFNIKIIGDVKDSSNERVITNISKDTSLAITFQQNSIILKSPLIS